MGNLISYKDATKIILKDLRQRTKEIPRHERLEFIKSDFEGWFIFYLDENNEYIAGVYRPLLELAKKARTLAEFWVKAYRIYPGMSTVRTRGKRPLEIKDQELTRVKRPSSNTEPSRATEDEKIRSVSVGRDTVGKNRKPVQFLGKIIDFLENAIVFIFSLSILLWYAVIIVLIVYGTINSWFFS